MDNRVETDREFWRAVRLAGDATAIPRWTLAPAPGVAERVATLDDDLAAGGRRLADELKLPLHLLTELGGTTLSAVKLAIVVNRAVSLEDIAEHAILADMAESLHREHAPERLTSSSGK
jgi:hypothetical protein